VLPFAQMSVLMHPNLISGNRSLDIHQDNVQLSNGKTRSNQVIHSPNSQGVAM
jgi:hypothetical protein